MDEAIVGERGGFRTRAEVISEAVENLLNELDFPEAPPISREEESPPGVPDQEHNELALDDLSATALRAPAEAPYLIPNEPSVERGESPLLGLHNRDYVSIWALHRLARYTADGPIEFADYLDRVTRAAWYFGSRLRQLESRDEGRKLTVLFPTNPAKRPSAERGFQSFAVGNLPPPRAERGSGAGPLFEWQAIRPISPGNTAIALTEVGWQLIRGLDGLSLELPHSAELAARFLDYLAAHAPNDRWGFDHLLETAEDGPDRKQLIISFAAPHPEWTTASASSVAQGYVARSREWGLLEPSLIDGRYWLTEVGRRVVQELDPGPVSKEQGARQ